MTLNFLNSNYDYFNIFTAKEIIAITTAIPLRTCQFHPGFTAFYVISTSLEYKPIII